LTVDDAGMFQLVDRRAEPLDGHGLSEKHLGQMPWCWHRVGINFGQTASGNSFNPSFIFCPRFQSHLEAIL